jgi:hypothetical protein
MTNDGRREDREFAFEDEFDYLFANTSPNPTREGCPSRDTLAALSRRELPIGDPGYMHIVRCSPCFREFRAMQQARKRQKRVRTIQLLTAAAAVIAVAVVGSIVLLRDRGPSPGEQLQPAAGAQPASLQARLDLRPFSVTRGDPARLDPEPLLLPRARVNSTLLLPVGADTGSYELRLLDRDLAPRVIGNGTATIVDFITTLEATLDLSGLEPGAYQFGIRRAGGEWQMFPAQVK